MMRLITLLSFSISFILLLSCSHVNSTFEVKIASEKTQLPANQKINATTFMENIQKVNQVIDDLNLLLVEFQKNDELEEAIEMMKTAKNEANKNLAEMRTIKVKNKSLDDFKHNYEDSLQGYIDGLQLQIEGMENWSAGKMTQGFQRTKKYEGILKDLYQKAITK